MQQQHLRAELLSFLRPETKGKLSSSANIWRCAGGISSKSSIRWREDSSGVGCNPLGPIYRANSRIDWMALLDCAVIDRVRRGTTISNQLWPPPPRKENDDALYSVHHTTTTPHRREEKWSFRII
ncbi:GL23992 [Drosophila persimilis]|uniref:GL23992 n=1 Tax=Drosophila persimilis TaxID=7234 RepID=B4G2X5_DROPE|nr:GL23992 [Drosophila persimilis]